MKSSSFYRRRLVCPKTIDDRYKCMLFFLFIFSSVTLFLLCLSFIQYCKYTYIFILCLILLFLLFYSVAFVWLLLPFSNFNVLGTLKLLKSNNNNKIKNYCDVYFFFFSFFFVFISFFILLYTTHFPTLLH